MPPGLEVTGPESCPPSAGRSEQAHGRCWDPTRQGCVGPTSLGHQSRLVSQPAVCFTEGEAEWWAFSPPRPAPPCVAGTPASPHPQYWRPLPPGACLRLLCSSHPQLPRNPGAPWSHRSPRWAAASPSPGWQGKQSFRKVGAGGGHPRKLRRACELPEVGLRFRGCPQAGAQSCRGWGTGHVVLKTCPVLVRPVLAPGWGGSPSPLCVPFPPGHFPCSVLSCRALSEVPGSLQPRGTCPHAHSVGLPVPASPGLPAWLGLVSSCPRALGPSLWPA